MAPPFTHRSASEDDGSHSQAQHRITRRRFTGLAGAALAAGLAPVGTPASAAGGRDVQGLVLPDTGHWLAEESPDQPLAALTPFLAPYRTTAR